VLAVNMVRTLTKRPIQTLTRMIHLALKKTESPNVNINAWIRETTIRMFQRVLLFSDGAATDLYDNQGIPVRASLAGGAMSRN
jgi:hypothetical protein